MLQAKIYCILITPVNNKYIVPDSDAQYTFLQFTNFYIALTLINSCITLFH